MMLRRLRASLEMSRPRSLARMQKSLDDLVEGVRILKRGLKEQVERDKAAELGRQVDASAVGSRLDELNARVRELADAVTALTLREAQLRAIASADALQQDAMAELPSLCCESRIIAHVHEAVRRSELQLAPLPYMVIGNVFPADFSDALVRSLPPYEMFADKPRNKQQLKVPLSYGPVFVRIVWKFLVEVALERAFRPAIVDAPHWIDPARCLAADVPFRRNTALVFLNCHGAHGASIPDDAEPADLQRYIYQFRIGPTKAAIQKLVAMLPEERRSSWEGKVVDYLA
jgi:hypothetical protein